MAADRSSPITDTEYPAPVQPLRDARLLERIKAGEPLLFHDLIRPYERGLYLVAYSVLLNVGDAEEVAQESVLKALTHLDRLRSNEKFKQWLFQIAVNEARMRRRKYRRARYESLDQDFRGDRESDALRFDFPDHRPLPSEVLHKKELRVAVRRAVEMLPLMYREACVLHDVDQLEIEEVAHVLAISVSAAKTRCHRARMQLRKALIPLLLGSNSRPNLS